MVLDFYQYDHVNFDVYVYQTDVNIDRWSAVYNVVIKIILYVSAYDVYLFLWWNYFI